MGLSVPTAVKPFWDFAVHVVVGAVSFCVVLLVAVALSGVVHLLERWVGVPPWILEGAAWAEFCLFWGDLFLFGLFLVSESLKLVRGILASWRE